MGIKLSFYKFGVGAKNDLLALGSQYSYADIVRIVKQAPLKDSKGGRVTQGDLIITLEGKTIIAVTLSHLKEYPRSLHFNCTVCFDTNKVKVGDPCDYCDGSSCGECKEGLIYKFISCPNCSTKYKVRGENSEWSDTVKHRKRQSYGNRGVVPKETRRNGRGKTRRRNKSTM